MVVSKREWRADAAACPDGKLPYIIPESGSERLADVDQKKIDSAAETVVPFRAREIQAIDTYDLSIDPLR